MKKILSLTLAVLMVVSMIPTAFAAEAGGNWGSGTTVSTTGERTTINDDGSATYNVEYTITVPAQLAPGGSGTVTLEGYWPSDATVKVTADASVDVLNSINNADKKTLAVTFPSIEKAGNNTESKSYDATVSVAGISDALFGTWSGKFNYNVDYTEGASGNAGDSGTTTEPTDPDTGDDGEQATLITFTIDGTEYQAEKGMTWLKWRWSDDYDSGDFFVNSMSQVENGAGLVVQDENGIVSDNSPIKDGYAYTTTTK